MTAGIPQRVSTPISSVQTQSELTASSQKQYLTSISLPSSTVAALPPPRVPATTFVPTKPVTRSSHKRIYINDGITSTSSISYLRSSPYRSRHHTYRHLRLQNHLAHFEGVHSISSSATAVNLDQTGHPLTYKSAINGPEAAQWHIAEAEEFERLLNTSTICFIPHQDKPKERQASYCNPQPRIKMKNGIRVFRIRETCCKLDINARQPDCGSTR